MPSLGAYVLSFLTLLTSCALSIVAIALPRWLYFESPRPNRTITNYGLFVKCSTLDMGCRPFPSEDYGDCDEEGFCEVWSSARIDILLATLICSVSLLYVLVFVLISGSAYRGEAWKWLAGLFALSAFLQTSGVSVIYYLKGSSILFEFEGLNYSFIMASVSSGLSWLNAIGLGLAGYLPQSPQYDPVPTEED